MSKETYTKPYAILQEHVNVPLINVAGATETIKNVVMRIEDQDIEMKIEGFSVRRTDGGNTDVEVEVEVYELVSQVIDGTILDPNIVISANLDRDAGRDKIGLEIFEDSTIPVLDSANSVRMFDGGAVASRSSRLTTPAVGEPNYSLSRNTDYLLRATVLNGTVGVTESNLIFDLTLTKENGE